MKHGAKPGRNTRTLSIVRAYCSEMKVLSALMPSKVLPGFYRQPSTDHHVEDSANDMAGQILHQKSPRI